MSIVANAVVTAKTPLMITMDGDSVSIPALPVGYSGSVGARVRVQVRRGGLLPIVQVTL